MLLETILKFEVMKPHVWKEYSSIRQVQDIDVVLANKTPNLELFIYCEFGLALTVNRGDLDRNIVVTSTVWLLIFLTIGVS